MSLTLIDLEPRIGVTVEASKSDLLSGSHTAELRALLASRAVLVFPRVDFSDLEHLAFSRTLGTVIPVGEEGIRPISRVGIDAAYITASFHWHFDGAFDDVPALAGLLTARQLSTNGGGRTQFANTYAAYADLPEDEKEAYDRLHVVHSFEANQRINDPVPSYKTLLAWRQRYPYPKVQPLVWHHRNGLNSLAVGTTASHVDGMSLDDGRLLLAKLLDWCTQPQYVYTHDWEVGDLVVYDNTAVLHRVTPYAADSDRLMKRTALVGEEPLV